MYIFFSFAYPQPEPFLTYDGSNDVVWSKEVPFGGQNDENLSVTGLQPQKPPIFWRQ